MGQAFSFVAAVAQPPTLAGSQTSLVAAAAPSAALSIADVISVMKLFFLVAITVVPCVTYGVSLWRLTASRSSNSGNPMAASSAGTESPGNEGGGISAGMGDIEQLPLEGILINIPLPGTSSTDEGSTNSTVLTGSMDFTGGNDQMASFSLSL
ncbi:unnamed protein product [Sphagnum troendelagicum]|uniref:Uncharacterized protein n=1 Tax=Sphagnum troendelagicum TaxID=128251 RepID=A0ABP0T8Q5_9BRYO